MSVSLACAALALAGASDPALEYLKRMMRAWDGVQTLTYRLNKVERMRDGELVREAAFVKVRKPDSFYIAALEPRRGQEVIYVGARDPKRLIVHPGRFPDFTLRLGIRGGLATRRQHHLVTHSGLGYTLEGLADRLALVRQRGDDGRIVHNGEGRCAGRQVDLVTLHAGSVEPARIQARQDESLFDFAERVGQDAYVIFYTNPEIDALTDDLEAKDYLVPAYYSSRDQWALDQETGLPICTTFWDAEGRLYERYEYVDMRVNPPLTDADFDPDNPAYDF